MNWSGFAMTCGSLTTRCAMPVARRGRWRRVCHINRPMAAPQDGTDPPAFLLAQVDALGQELAALGIRLHLLHVDTFAELPQALVGLCRELGVSQLYANQAIEIDELRRDRRQASFWRRRGFPRTGLTAAVCCHRGEY